MASMTLHRVTLTNVSSGPRVVNCVPAILLEAGASASVEMNDAEWKAAKATGWFAMNGKSQVGKSKAKASDQKATDQGAKADRQDGATIMGNAQD